MVTQNTENVARVLREDPDFAGRFRYDSFTLVHEIKDTHTGKWRALEDNDALIVQTLISIKYDFFRKLGKDMAFDAMLMVSTENSFDSAIEHIRTEAWDGVARLDSWLTHVYGTPDDEYHQKVASNWMKGLVRRIVEPGCKFDYVLVLEGEQGVKKSTSLHILGQMPNGKNGHVETTMSTDSKDFFMQMQGKFIVEFSEGETLSRTEVKKLKAIITTQVDKYRMPYARVSLDFPRRCAFAMTTNQDEYLKDETGNRRWLPVKVLKDEADIEWLIANRAQLFAEAYHRVIEKGETTFEFPVEETRRQQEARRVSDPNEDRIAEWYWKDEFANSRRFEDGVTVQEVHAGALSGFGPLKKHEEMSIAGVLMKMGLEKRRKMVNGIQSMRWFPPASYKSPFDSELEKEFAEDDIPDLS